MRRDDSILGPLSDSPGPINVVTGLQRGTGVPGNFFFMPLRDLPTESQAAAALIRTELLTHRRTIRRTGKPGLALACLAAGAVFAVLLPGPAGTGCYLWRATTQPV